MTLGYESVTNAGLAALLRSAFKEYCQVRSDVHSGKRRSFPDGGQAAILSAYAHVRMLRIECRKRIGIVAPVSDEIKSLTARPNYIRIPKA